MRELDCKGGRDSKGEIEMGREMSMIRKLNEKGKL
jgi:hypothetical protein